MKNYNTISVETLSQFTLEKTPSQKKQARRRQESFTYSWSPPFMNEFQIIDTGEHSLPEHRALEKYSLSKLKVMDMYLLDTLETRVFNCKKERIKFELDYKRINLLLQGGDKSFCTVDHLYVPLIYKQTKNVNVGRLYAQRIFSYNYLSREIRYLLLDKEYQDFDMENAHPTLMLQYANDNIANVSTKLLSRYINNREDVLLEKMEVDIIERSVAKRDLLKVLNTTKSHAMKLGHLCPELHAECANIRDHIFEKMYFPGSAIWTYYDGNRKFHAKDLESKKVSVQSIYLQSLETDYVLRGITFLRSGIESWLLSKSEVDGEQIKSFLDENTNKLVNVGALEYNISCIPFFDGFFAGSENPYIGRDIASLMDSFNGQLEKEGSLVRFRAKALEKEDDKRINSSLFKAYTNIWRLLSSLNTKNFNQLLALMDIQPINFTKDRSASSMLNTSREFRRALFKKLMESSESEKLTLDSEFLKEMSSRYASKLTREHLDIYADFETLDFETLDPEVETEDSSM